ncbi:MAG: hypothetical protein AAF702_41295 [Chloroflexota bacterium]
MNLSLLQSLPENVQQSNELIASLDAIFSDGFARLESEHLDALSSLNHAFAATPLASNLTAVITAVSQSEFLENHFLLLAAARAALQGAQHDALLAQACQALGRTVPELIPVPDLPSQAPSGQLELWCESIRHWLMELVLAGFTNLEVESVLAFQATLADIQAEPRMVRHAALLNGLIAEILQYFPTKGVPEIPLFRWVDLWSRAFVLAAQPPEAQPAIPISGEFYPLGAHLRQSDVVVNLVIFGWLEGEEGGMLLRTNLSAFRVDVITGIELKSLFDEIGATLLTALAEQKSIFIEEILLQNTGDMLWQEKNVKLGKSIDLAALASRLHSEPPVSRWTQRAEDRHPALIHEFVYLEHYRIENEAIYWGELAFPLALERIADSPDMPLADLTKGASMIALLCFDAGCWSLQPLSVLSKGKKKGAVQTQGIFVQPKGKKAKSTLPQLRERASRLLRKK